jgi:type IV secretory pathway VirB10-like protein
MLALEEYAERAEAARLAALNTERENILRPYSSVPVESLNLETLADAEWLALLGDFKAAHADRLKREAAEKAEHEQRAKDEAERLEKAEQEAARLRAEAAERDKELAAERRQREEAERAVAEAKRKADADAAAKRADEERAMFEQAEAARKAAIAPDKEKLIAFADTLAKLPLPELSVSTAGLIPVKEQMRKFIAWIVKEASKL